MEPEKQVDLQAYLQKIQPVFQKHKKIWITGLSLVGIIALIYIVGPFLVTSPEDAANNFKKAIQEKDVAAIQKMIHVSDTEPIEIDETSIKNLLTHIHKDKKYLRTLHDSLDRQVANWDSEKPSMLEVALFGWDDDFYVVKKEIPFFYDTHMISAKPYYLYLQTTEDQVELQINGKKVFTSSETEDELQYGPVLPSVYQITAEKQFPYTVIKSETELEAIGNISPNIHKKILVPSRKIDVVSNFDDTQILVNGKPSGKTTADGKDFGPVSIDGSTVLTGQKKFPWGIEKSKPIQIKEQFGSIHVTPITFTKEADRKAITQHINTFIEQLHKSYLELETKHITSVHDNLKNYYTKEIDKMIQYEDVFKGNLLGTRLAFGHVTLKPDDENNEVYYAEIPIEVHKKARTYSKYNTGKEPLKETFSEEIIVLQYHAKTKKWTIFDYKKRNPLDFNFTKDYFQDDDVVKTQF